MSLFGKVLALLNLLAAGAFVYLALETYSQHRNWSYLSYRFGLVQQGPPVDVEQTDLRDNKLVEMLDPPTLEKLKVGGKELKTQDEEVKRLKLVMEGKATGQPFDAEGVTLNTPLQRWAWVLRPYADNFSRRDALTRLIRNPNHPLTTNLPPLFEKKRQDALDKITDRPGREKYITAELETDFGNLFQLALDSKQPPEERRPRIAHILFCMVEGGPEEAPAVAPKTALDGGGYARWLATVGYGAAIVEIEFRAQMLDRMVVEAEKAIARDREKFLREHERILERVLALKEAFDRAKARNLDLDDQIAKQQKLVAAQQMRVDDAKTELSTKRQESADLIKAQMAKEQAIFDAQKSLRDAIEKTAKLEKALRQAEVRLVGETR